MYLCKSTPNVPHYFFKNQSTLLIIGSLIYVLLITINILKSFYRFLYLFVPIDLYCLHKEITKDDSKYNLYSNINDNNMNIDEHLNSNSNNASETGGIKDKLDKLAGLVYEYLARKRKISINGKHKHIRDNMKKDKYKKKNTKEYINKQNINTYNTSSTNTNNVSDIDTQIKENYKPDIVKLRDMMVHTIDNIHDY